MKRLKFLFPALSGIVLIAGCFAGVSNHLALSTSTPTPSDSFFSSPVPIGVKADQPGFSAEVNGKYAGFDIDVADYLAEKKGFASGSFVTVNDLNRESSLGKTVKLVIATYSITEDRKIDWAGPYLTTPEGLLVRRNSKLARNPNDLAGARICTLSGSTASRAHLPSTVIMLTSQPNYSACVKEVENGDADAVFTDWLILYGYAQDTAEYPNVILEPTQYGEINQYGIGVPLGSKDACQELINLVRLYVNSGQWATDFLNEFPEIRKFRPSWKQDFEPNVDTLDAKSRCL